MTDTTGQAGKDENNEQTNKVINEKLLTTLNHTNETNEKLMESNEHLVKILSAQSTTGRLKVLFLTLPIIIYLIYTISGHLANKDYDDKGYVAQVVLKGEIRMESGTASADVIIPALRKAFEDKDAKGVIFRISSPGGSPTQSILIHDELLKLQNDYPDKKLVVVGEESLTSGAYWIAAAAKEIHVLPATFTGSIGVIFSMYDVSKLAKRFEVSKRVITAGSNKHRVDMFIEPRPEDLVKLKSLADQLHEQFIEVVNVSRKDRLKGDHKELFSGDFWLGKEALNLGLVDSVTSTSRLLNKEFGTDIVKDYSKKESFFESITFACLSWPMETPNS